MWSWDKIANQDYLTLSHWVTQRAIAIYPCWMYLQDPCRHSSTFVSSQSSTHYSRRNKRAFNMGGRTLDQVTLLTQDIEDSFSAKKKARAIRRSHSSLRHCVTSRPHVRVAAMVTWQVHGLLDHGAGWESQLHPYHRQRQTEQVKNSVHQGSNVCTSDLPTTISKSMHMVTT